MKKWINSGSEFEEKIGYSRAVFDGDCIFVSGTTGFNYRDMSISDDAVQQAEQCFKNIEQALKEAGAELKDIVRVNYIFPKRDDFEPCWPVFKRYLAEAKPAATMIVAGLYDERMKLEIEVTASLPK